MKNVHFIIRTIGERTLGLAIYAYNKIGSYPTIITGNPFGETLKRCYKNAIEENKEYTVMVDADMIPLNSFNIDFLINNFNKDCFETHFSGIDMYFQKVRPIGVRVYKTEKLKDIIDEIDVNNKRPESVLIHKYGFSHSDEIIVTHGYEQYYSDLLRSSITIAERNKGSIVLSLINFLKMSNNINTLKDRLTIINGFEHFLINKEINKVQEKSFINYKEYDKILEKQELMINGVL